MRSTTARTEPELSEPLELTLEGVCDEGTGFQELTVFDPTAEDPTSSWLSVDAAVAVPIDEVR